MDLGSGYVGFVMLMELCQRILDSKGMPADWATSVPVHIFMEKKDIMYCEMHMGVNLLKPAIKIVEEVFL